MFGCAWDLFEMYRLDDPDGDRLRATLDGGIAVGGRRRTVAMFVQFPSLEDEGRMGSDVASRVHEGWAKPGCSGTLLSSLTQVMLFYKGMLVGSQSSTDVVTSFDSSLLGCMNE